MANKISIILSGGAAKGSFSCGALQAVYEKFGYDNIEMITGTSVGSINGAMYASKKFPELLDVWKSIKSWKDIYENWTFGYLEGFFRGGLVSFNPMREKISRYIDESLLKSSIKFYSCVINMNTKEKEYAGNDGRYSLEEIRKFIEASSAMSPQFPPVKIGNSIYADGGYREPIPVKYCVDNTTETDKYIIITNKRMNKVDSHREIKTNFFSILKIVIDSLSKEVFSNDFIVGSQKYWNDPDKFVVVEADKNYVHGFKEGVNHDNIMKDIENGYNLTVEKLHQHGLW